MPSMPMPPDEKARLSALHRYGILDTLPEDVFDDFTRLASYICGTPTALISLLDEDRQWFKSRVGMNVTETSRDIAFCGHAIVQSEDVLEVPNTTLDDRFADNPLVTGDENVRFYAGAPLVTPEGHAVGTLCVIDTVPRILSPEQRDALSALARQVVAQMELRRQTAEQQFFLSERARVTRALERSEYRSRSILSAALDCVVMIDAHGIITEWNPAAEKTFGWKRAEVLGRKHMELIVPERFHAAHEQGMARFRATGEAPILNIRVERPALRRDQTEFPTELTMVPLVEEGEIVFAAFVRDLSAQKASEERLRLLATALENANDVVLITEAEPVGAPGPRVVYVNEAFTRLTGYAAEEILGKTPRILQGPATDPETCAFMRKKLKAWKPVQVELLNYRKDGTPFWSQLNIRPVADEKGWFTHWVSVQRDVTEQHDAQEAEREDARQRESRLSLILQENEARFQGVVEGLTEGILITDFDDVVLYINPRLTEIAGWTEAEMLGRPAYEFLLDPEDWPNLHDGNRRREEGSSDTWEACLRRKDGSRFWAENNATPFRDAAGQIVGTLGAITDISARKALQADQERLSQRTQLMLNAAGEGFFGINLEGRNTFVNPAAAQMLGYTVEELLGLSMHDTLHHTHVDGRPYPREDCPIYAAFTDGAVHRVTNEVFWRKDGTSFPVEYVSTPVYEAGALIGAVVTFRNITQRRMLEAEQHRLLEEALKRADCDPLTGLLNHRAFHKKLEEEADRAQREDGVLMVALIDLDNFKFFNDAYGHAAGDDVLRQVADVLRQTCRPYDTLARFGGDEFALLLPGATDVRALAATLTERLGSVGYCPPGYETPIPVGVSVGAATFPEDAATRAEVVSLADGRLHRAKAGESETEDLIANLRARLPASSAEGFAMLCALVTAVDTKDRYTRRHSEDVLAYSLQIAAGLRLSEDVQHTIAVAALLHDVGKVGVPDAVLRKPGQLSDDEFQAIRQHPVMGAAIVGAVPGFETTLDAVRHHHERWDGGGYPFGLRGEEIPLMARIMAVADAFSAMTTDRPYRKGMAEARALNILKEEAGTQWDERCVASFLSARASAGKP